MKKRPIHGLSSSYPLHNPATVLAAKLTIARPHRAIHMHTILRSYHGMLAKPFRYRWPLAPNGTQRPFFIDHLFIERLLH